MMIIIGNASLNGHLASKYPGFFIYDMSTDHCSIECPLTEIDADFSDSDSEKPRRHPICHKNGDFIRFYNPKVLTLSEILDLSECKKAS